MLLDLALQVVRDGEGAQKLVKVTVRGAVSDTSAKRVAMAIANSPLVKTAIAGEDANWGRIVMAVGKAGEPADRDRLSVAVGGTWMARDGGVVEGYRTRLGPHPAGPTPGGVDEILGRDGVRTEQQVVASAVDALGLAGLLTARAEAVRLVEDEG